VSSLIVEVCRVDAVEKHPNADKMCICTVKGWKTCAVRDPASGKNQFDSGDLCVYIPPDSVLPPELADRLGVTKYLSSLPISEITGEKPGGGRVKVARLRGFPSYGLIMPPDDPSWPLGLDVAAVLGITKWEPPPDSTDGDRERSHPAFHSYFNLENYRNFPDLIPDGEEVVFTEKLHGKNCRLGLIRTTGAGGTPTWTWMAGSHDVRRKEFCVVKKRKTDPQTGEETIVEIRKRSQFWECFTEPVKALMTAASDGKHDVVVFGELYGSGVQDMTYGLDGGRFGFRVFDITLDGKYLDCDAKKALCDRHGVDMVPILFRGPFSKQKVEEYVSGPTTMCPANRAGKFKGREGIVFTATVEKAVSTEKMVFERMALKAISFEYLERKDGTEFH